MKDDRSIDEKQQFLEYPTNYNPWQTSIDKLCDHWSEWAGMQSLVNQQQKKQPK